MKENVISKYNIISEYVYLKLPCKPRERKLYRLPKIHKIVEKWTKPDKIPSVRPIVSHCNSE